MAQDKDERPGGAAPAGGQTPQRHLIDPARESAGLGPGARPPAPQDPDSAPRQPIDPARESAGL